MIPRAAHAAAFAIAAIIVQGTRERGKAFEEIWDEVEAGHSTYGKSEWTRFIQRQPADSDYWFKIVRTKCFAEIDKKLLAHARRLSEVDESKRQIAEGR